MISGFQSLSSINSGLILQQLEQDITASNLAQPSLDSQGYLLNSLERVNTGTAPTVSFSGANGPISVGSGVAIDSITRLRDSFLDGQIRSESTTVGYNEILANTSGTGVLNQINSVINSSSTNTLNYALTQFQSAWQALGANIVPANDAADRAAVVSAGTSFAQMANSQYSQLQNLQLAYNGKIQDSVTQINQLFQQLNSINQQLNTTQGSNPSSLLDARDYALDRLSRLMNFQVIFGNNGTASLFLNGLMLVSSGGAGQLQSDIPDPNNPALADITLVPPANLNSMQTGGNSNTVPPVPSSTVDLTSMITGGNLGGELQARNVILQSYKQQVNQATTAVMNVVNTLQSAGFASDGVTTGTLFFEGTGASNITVNGVLGSNNGLVAESSVAFGAAGAAAYPGAPLVGNQQISQMLGGGVYAGSAIVNPGLMNLLIQNFAASNGPINPTAAPPPPPVNPYAALDTTVTSIPGVGSFSINGVTIAYNGATDSLATIIQEINTNVTGVTAVYNAASQQIFIFSSGQVVMQDVSGIKPFASVGGNIGWTKLINFMVGTSTLNNSFDPNMPDVFVGAGQLWSPMNSIVPAPNPPPTIPPTYQPSYGPNVSAFAVTPSATGSVTINGKIITWNNTEAFNTVRNQIQAATGVAAQAVTYINTLLPTFFGGNAVQVYEMQSGNPIQVYDDSGNFTATVGMNNNNNTLGELSNEMLGQVNSDLTNQQLMSSQAQDSLNQLNTAQANIAGIQSGTPTSSTGIPTSSSAGVPLAAIQQQATQAALTYNALLEVMSVIDNMYNSLIDIIGGTSTSTSGVFAGK